MMNNNTIIDLLQNFDLTPKEGEIYLTLLQKGILSPLQLSRSTSVNRTTIYRILEKLKKTGLVEEVVDEKRTKAKAISPDKFEMLIKQKEAEVDRLKQNLPFLKSQLITIQGTTSPETKVLYYRGQNGLQQLLWNTLKAANQTEVVGYGYQSWNDYVGKNFAEKLRQEYVERKIISKEILNKTDASMGFTDNKEYKQQVFSHRQISRNKLEINYNTIIYCDVFAFYSLYQGDIFGVEIYNAEIAKTQRQIFYLLWQLAKPASS